MKRIFYLICFVFISLNTWAQQDSTKKFWPKHKVWIYDNQNGVQEGVLISTTDSSLRFFPGRFSDWKRHSQSSEVNQSYGNIQTIKTHKKDGLITGILFGAGIGLSPILLGAIFGEGQGGAYVSVITFPLGIITGAIIGSTAKRKFYIGSGASKFHLFHKRIKY